MVEEPRWLTQILDYFKDQDLNEVMLSASGKITLTTKKIFHKSETIVLENHLTEEVQDFVFAQNMRLDPFSPFAGGKIKGAMFRWHAVIPPVVEETRFFLRRHRFESLELKDFSFGKDCYVKIQNIIENKEAFLVVGPTGSGKTTLLNSLLSYFKKQKLIILEDYDEIPICSDLWFKMLTRKKDIEERASFSLQDLFIEALRMRPDHLVLGELRGQELKTFLETCLSGHTMTCSTIHANSVDDLRKRFQFMIQKDEQLLDGIKIWTLLMTRSQGKPLIQTVERLTFNNRI